MNGHDIIGAFRRHGDGSWLCVDPVTIDHPIGQIQVSVGTKLMRGTIFMGVDLASWLDEYLGDRAVGAAE